MSIRQKHNHKKNSRSTHTIHSDGETDFIWADLFQSPELTNEIIE